jgi:hypothetical protein
VLYEKSIFQGFGGSPPPTSGGFKTPAWFTAFFVPLFFALALLFSGCDALKGLYGEIYGEDDGPDGGGNSGGSGSGGGGGDESGSGGGGAYGIPVVFEGIAVAEDETTTLVSLHFDRDIDGLSVYDVTITSVDYTGAVKGVLSPTNSAGVYTLAVSGVQKTGEITVSMSKSGYTFNPASLTATVNFKETANKVSFASAIADGEAGSQTTTKLAFLFSQAITDLDVSDITLWPGSTGAVKGSLTGSGQAYSLAVSGITAAGDVYVTVVKSGYAVSPATVPVAVHYKTIPLATGGDITYEPEGDNPLWEIHKFTVDELLIFSDGRDSVVADYLVVAGGGGAGGHTASGIDYAGGGGAGGLLYKTEATLFLQDGSVNVTVGTGGNGGSGNSRGNSGGLSAIGDVEVPGGGTGGGSGGNDANNVLNGLAGGSGGGGGAGNSSNHGTGGQRNSDELGINWMGHPGGNGASSVSNDSGGGGGGAGGVGANGLGSGVVVAGGVPWNATGDASWIQTATGTAAFSRGGDGGGVGGSGAAGENYGDGGSGGTAQSGGNGHSGIVVIRFQRSSNN